MTCLFQWQALGESEDLHVGHDDPPHLWGRLCVPGTAGRHSGEPGGTQEGMLCCLALMLAPSQYFWQICQSVWGQVECRGFMVVLHVTAAFSWSCGRSSKLLRFSIAVVARNTGCCFTTVVGITEFHGSLIQSTTLQVTMPVASCLFCSLLLHTVSAANCGCVFLFSGSQ